MKTFEYIKAEDARHAVALLARHASAARILAGGTDLLVELKSAAHAPEVVIDISRAAELQGIAVTEEGLRLGALVTHSEIVHSALIHDVFPGLAEAARSIGAAQTRNLATLGGNLMTCVPSMDSGPMLIALDAHVTVESPRGRRQIPLHELFVGPRKTALKPDELLVDIVIPKRHLGKPAAFQKLGLRKGQALALVNAAASFWTDQDNGSFREVRIALGAVAPTVIRAVKAEACLEGRPITAQAMAEAGRIAASEAKPISDFRASAGYRRDLIAVLVKRALESAHAQAIGKARVQCLT
jgi:CO/xanthine dehydrogenase FAD-binding subunit